jgi:hypothetical protein
MKAIVIDNFFKNPDDVRNLALRLKYRSRDPHEFFEGIRSQSLHEINNKFYNDICSKIIIEYFGAGNYSYEASVFFHQTSNNDKQDPQWINHKIHTDPVVTTGIIFLTPNSPIACGTQTYRNINGTYVPDVVMGNQYNRLIAYDGAIPHSAMDFFGNEDSSRLVMLCFIEKIKPVDRTIPAGLTEPLVYEALS